VTAGAASCSATASGAERARIRVADSLDAGAAPSDCSGNCWYMCCVIFQWPPAFQNEQLPETRWLRLAGSADGDRPLACCPDCPDVAFDGDVVESERKVQAHVLESSVLCGRKLLTPYDVSSWGYTTAALPVY
jgi:hypothetical protein